MLFPSPGDLPDPGVEATCPALAGGFFTPEPPGKPSVDTLILGFSAYSLASGLQNCERINYCHFKPASLW